MNKGIRFTDEFKQDAVAQVVDRGYAVSEVAERLGISTMKWSHLLGQFCSLAAQTKAEGHDSLRPRFTVYKWEVAIVPWQTQSGRQYE